MSVREHGSVDNERDGVSGLELEVQGPDLEAREADLPLAGVVAVLEGAWHPLV